MIDQNVFLDNLTNLVNRKMEELQWKKEDIGLLFMSIEHLEYAMPSTAFMMQKRLEISKDAIVFDYFCEGDKRAAGVKIVEGYFHGMENKKKALILTEEEGNVEVTAICKGE